MPSAHKPAVSDTGDPLLLTPGPLTTGKRVKEVMVHDWGSRDAAFLKINSEMLTRLLINGAYGQRAKKILDIAKRKVTVHETPEDTPPDLAAVEHLLKADATI